jgi:hypothetical protein
MGLKGGCTEMVIMKELPLPEITLTQRIAFGILCSLEVYNEESYVKWAKDWLSGEDRTSASDAASAAASAARAAVSDASAAARAAERAAASAAASDARAAARAAEWAAASPGKLKELSLKCLKYK